MYCTHVAPYLGTRMYPRLAYCLNDSLSFFLFFFSPHSHPVSSLPPFSCLAGGALLSETHSPSDTWLTVGQGRGERDGTGVTQTQTTARGEKETVGHLRLVPCYSAAVPDFGSFRNLEGQRHTERDKGGSSSV